jgi:cytochrome c5
MRFIAITLALLLLAGLPVGCGESEEKKDEGKPAADAGKDIGKAAMDAAGDAKKAVEAHAGKAVMEASCVACHEIEKVTAAKKSADDWEAQVEMCTEADPLEEADAKVLLEYLAKTYGE